MRAFSIAVRIGSFVAGVQTTKPFIGVERVNDGARAVSFHVGLFPVR